MALICIKHEYLRLLSIMTSIEDAQYLALLDRVYDAIDKSQSQRRGKLKMPPPNVDRRQGGGRQVVWTNFSEICNRGLRRPAEHVKAFFEGELQTSTSINGTGGLVINGRFFDNNIQSILGSYIQAYLMCLQCRGTRTEMVKNDGIWTILCKECKASRSLSK